MTAPLPRGSLAALSVVHAIPIGWAAVVLPWRAWTLFGVLTGSLAAAHALVAVLAIARHRWLPRAWSVCSGLSLLWLLYCVYAVTAGGVYLAAVYGSLGQGVAAALGLVLAPVTLLSLPYALWGLARTMKSRRSRRRVGAASVVILLLCAGGLLREHYLGRADPVPIPPLSELEAALAALTLGPATGTSLLTRAPTECAEPFDRPTLIATWTGDDGAPTTTCVQSDDLAAALAAHPTRLRAPVKLDLVVGVQPLVRRSRVVDGLALRPGLDGACGDGRCLMPWQLGTTEIFVTHTPLPFIRDLRAGVDAALLRALLGLEGDELDGLQRIETRSWVLDEDGLHALVRAHHALVPVDGAHLEQAAIAAEEHILAAQQPDGRFRYLLDPHSGAADAVNFNFPRHAGTTLALCELGRDSESVRAAVGHALAFMATRAYRVDAERSAMARHGRTQPAKLGPTALPALAFLSCRARTGEQYDELIGRFARFLLGMQRPNGDFYPSLDLASGLPIEGPSHLYAAGQAVFALVLLERLAHNDGVAGLPPVAVLREAVDRAMDFMAGSYWRTSLYDFFFIEENWHCLAARAALEHHRHPGYEQLCLDYVAYKGRLVLDEDSDVDPDLIGGQGFGNVLVPQTTPSAGFGEALAAAMAIKAAREGDLTEERARMRLVLGFLLRQQFDERTCFACTPDARVTGGFPESPAAARIRIDYVQHAWAAIAHGARML